jgi:hypothetical protein
VASLDPVAESPVDAAKILEKIAAGGNLCDQINHIARRLLEADMFPGMS